MPDDERCVLYLRSRRPVRTIAALLGLCVAMVLVGRVTIQLPSRTGSGFVVTPIWAFFPLLLAALVVSSLDGDMDEVEEAATPSLARARALHVIVGVLVALVTGVVPLIWTGWLAEALVTVRNTLVWTGVAVASLRFVKPSLAWVAPMVVSLLVNWFGHQVTGTPQPWALTELPPTDVVSWCGAACCVVLSVVIVGLTPWRRHAIREKSRRKGVRHPLSGLTP